MQENANLDGAYVRKAKPEDRHKIVNLFNVVFEGTYPMKEYLDPDKVANTIRSNTHIWYLAFDKEKLIGSAAGIIDDWNNSIEFGKAAIANGYQGQGIISSLFDIITKDGVKEGADIFIGRPRNDQTYRVGKSLGMVVTGFLSGALRLSELETFLVSYKLSEKAKSQRIANKDNPLYSIEAIESISKELKLKDNFGEYPKESIVGPPLAKKEKIEINYESNDYSLVVSSIKPLLPFKKEYVQLDIVIDKLEEINFLKRLGFRICAFLPAWFKKGNKRFDCVRMVNSSTPPKVAGQLVGPVLKELIKKFDYY